MSLQISCQYRQALIAAKLPGSGGPCDEGRRTGGRGTGPHPARAAKTGSPPAACRAFAAPRSAVALPAVAPARFGERLPRRPAPRPPGGLPDRRRRAVRGRLRHNATRGQSALGCRNGITVSPPPAQRRSHASLAARCRPSAQRCRSAASVRLPAATWARAISARSRAGAVPAPQSRNAGAETQRGASSRPGHRASGRVRRGPTGRGRREAERVGGPQRNRLGTSTVRGCRTRPTRRVFRPLSLLALGRSPLHAALEVDLGPSPARPCRNGRRSRRPVSGRARPCRSARQPPPSMAAPLRAGRGRFATSRRTPGRMSAPASGSSGPPRPSGRAGRCASRNRLPFAPLPALCAGRARAPGRSPARSARPACPAAGRTPAARWGG